MTELWSFRWPSLQHPLFIGDSAVGTLTVGEWLRQLQACRTAASQLSGQRVLLYLDDSVRFSLWLFALLQAGKTVVLAPNGLSETLTQAASHVDCQLLANTPLPAICAETRAVDVPDDAMAQTSLPSQAQIVFFTSGSSGQPKLVPKSLWQLQTEIEVLQRSFAGLTAQQPMLVAATVPHQHIYGLLFRILWPLSAGWTLFQQTIHFAEQWLALGQGALPVMLVSSPAHLSRYDDVAVIKQQPAQFAVVFSSGGPLAQADAARIYQQSGLAVTEIYGSTETGGIGHRQYCVAEPAPAWQAFAGIALAQDAAGCLLLQSPYLTEQDWYCTSDLVTLHGATHFSLHGRVDRIVKLAEKRLALSEVESLCAGLSFVRQAVALLLPQTCDNNRPQLALVVELTDQGQQLLATQGKHAINQQIRQALASRFETVLLPRRFRYVRQLPFNAQGKLPLRELELLFLS